MARVWIAIEDPATAPWPLLPGKSASAGPFYLVWENPEHSASVASSGPINWPPSRPSNLRRIVGGIFLVVAASLPEDAAARRGLSSIHDAALALPLNERRWSR